MVGNSEEKGEKGIKSRASLIKVQKSSFQKKKSKSRVRSVSASQLFSENMCSVIVSDKTPSILRSVEATL